MRNQETTGNRGSNLSLPARVARGKHADAGSRRGATRNRAATPTATTTPDSEIDQASAMCSSPPMRNRVRASSLAQGLNDDALDGFR